MNLYEWFMYWITKNPEWKKTPHEKFMDRLHKLMNRFGDDWFEYNCNIWNNPRPKEGKKYCNNCADADIMFCHFNQCRSCPLRATDFMPKYIYSTYYCGENPKEKFKTRRC